MSEALALDSYQSSFPALRRLSLLSLKVGYSLADDHRIFVGDLGNEVTDETLTLAFKHYRSFNKAKVIRERWNNKTKGYGFVSFSDSADMVACMKSMNGALHRQCVPRAYVGARLMCGRAASHDCPCRKHSRSGV